MIFYRSEKWRIFKTRPSHRVTEKSLGIALFVTSFQAIDRFLAKNHVRFAFEEQKVGKCQINALFLVVITTK